MTRTAISPRWAIRTLSNTVRESRSSGLYRSNVLSAADKAGLAATTRFDAVGWFDEIDSTNRYLLDEARRGGPEGIVAVADHQTSGRGRLGRTWVAPRGSSLLVSLLLRPAELGLGVEDLHLVGSAAGLA